MNARPTALVVIAHHRADSLTAHIAARTATRLESAGYRVDRLDLRAEDYDPRMTAADQPDWGDRDKVYSDQTEAHMRRIIEADVIIPVFPVYWMSVPAILKGWIDRVWNYGFAYGRSKPKLAGKRMLWLGLAGAEKDDTTAPLMKQTLEMNLRDGISYYTGIAEAAVELLYDTEGEPQRVDEHGNFTKGEALAGAERESHYAALDREAVGYVEKFLSLT
ncbi:NAD(P)H oxidoreductase [Glycomyces buryatensis]|uniref:NAD(P)H oxidoreductase n=1 Tax=Glycomyces buryatensis TaxID=2570927 RepID=A0A4S8QE22_9ACTN|nr:NAD(P)H oxidoreductase [Glycomyces buryatensis]THV41901.1 NAD(P)H oxidoreductase [Glycomyces buryatensis]